MNFSRIVFGEAFSTKIFHNAFCIGLNSYQDNQKPPILRNHGSAYRQHHPLRLTSPKTMSAAVNEIKYSSINTIDELLISRVKTGLNASLLAYPATLRGKSDYISYTAKDLDGFVDKAARKFASLSLIPEVSW